VINALKKIEIEEMSISKFMGLPELLSIQYLTNISPLTLSFSPKGRGDHFMVVTEKRCLLLVTLFLDTILKLVIINVAKSTQPASN